LLLNAVSPGAQPICCLPGGNSVGFLPLLPFILHPSGRWVSKQAVLELFEDFGSEMGTSIPSATISLTHPGAV